jgi:hypothetical protein
MKKTILA